jgi:hypothetical protein
MITYNHRILKQYLAQIETEWGRSYGRPHKLDEMTSTNMIKSKRIPDDGNRHPGKK